MEMKKINLTEVLKAYRAAKEVTHDPYDDFQTEHFVKEKDRSVIETFLEASVKLNEALNEVQRRCDAHCMSPWGICESVEKIEKKLQITKKALTGCSFDVSVYEHSSMSTWVTLYFSGKAWFVTGIRRAYCKYNLSKSEYRATIHSSLTWEAKDAILANFKHF